MSPRRIEIQIDELVLHGVAPGDRYAVAEALHQRLEALVAEHGVDALLSQPGAFSQQAAAPISLAAGARPAELGRQIADTVHRGWR